MIDDALTDAAREFELDGHKFKLRRMRIREWQEVLRADVIRAHREQIATEADSYGITGEARIEYLARRSATIPVGSALDIKTAEWVYTVRGICCIIHVGTVELDGRADVAFEDVGNVIFDLPPGDAVERELVEMVEFVRDGYLPAKKNEVEESPATASSSGPKT